jgi:tetratricopeptide (TPR) repeat protein
MDTERFQRAMALRDSGQIEAELEELRSMAGSAVNQEEAAVLLFCEARSLFDLGRLSEARLRLDHALEVCPRTQTLLYLEFLHAMLTWHEGKPEKALQLLDSLSRQHHEDLSAPEHQELRDELRAKRGMLLAKLERFDDARPALEEALFFHLNATDRADVRYYLGVCHVKQGDPVKAKERLLEALQVGLRGDNSILVHHMLGVVYSRLGAHAKAIQEFQLCEPHAEAVEIPRKNLYGWLARESRELGLGSDADHYEKLAQGWRG